MANKKIRPIRVEGKIAYITLTQGYEAVIDVDDVPIVEGTCWRAMLSRRGDGSIYTVYAKRSVRDNGTTRTEYLHRMIANAPNGMDTDHRDGNGLNNQRYNLRIATRSQNMHNQRLSAANTSGYKGVVWNGSKKKWQAQIKINRKCKVIGVFSQIEDAASAYAAASAEMHKSFGRIA